MLLVSFALAGCTDAPSSTSEPAATAAADRPLHPVFPDQFTAASAESETVRVADAVEALLDPSDIVHVDDHAQEVPAQEDSAAYYGVIRTITLSPTVDPMAKAKAIEIALKADGWIERTVADEDGSYFAALASVALSAESWFILVGGDTSVAGQSVITLQLASPGLGN